MRTRHYYPYLVHRAWGPEMTASVLLQLVHVSHKLSVDSPAVDDQFSLSRPAVSIHRNVEVYQWVEHHKKQERKLRNGETEAQARTRC